MELELQDRVKAGAEYLDATFPGWRARINLEILDMGVSDRCILGQLFGDFDPGLRACGHGRGWAQDHGLFLWLDEGAYDEGRWVTLTERYAALTAAWRENLTVPS